MKLDNTDGTNQSISAAFGPQQARYAPHAVIGSIVISRH
jgi:hypothetical protein